MGESKRGRGGERSSTTTDLLALVQAELAEDKREPSEIRIQRLTEGLYAVSVTVHGESEPESYFLKLGADAKLTTET